ncbi:glycosyltransferase [Sphingomonas sp. Leaf357]|uniref:glycosyltransferase n=1 Tax=Sphingomonas sp. Leaf357 TaxID=1736350 RepID=UPI000AE3BDC5|nr:glycosyltransferase [Sphingomonas sp. Leaf357]
MQGPITQADMVVICAVDNRDFLSRCLMRSPDVAGGTLPVVTVEGAASMTKAYNEGLSRTDRTICLFAHQDVYLPKGWQARAVAALNALSEFDPKWQVAGPFGLDARGEAFGRVWDVSLARELGHPSGHPVAVRSFDELLLILRREPNYRFDEGLPHFHLYGTDIAQSALTSGRSAYAIDLPVIHNNQPVNRLDGGYGEAYRYSRRKWRDQLPIFTSVSTLSRNPLDFWRANRGAKARPARTTTLLADSVEAARQAGYE